MKRMLDLFSGLGGASEAFVGSWDVMRIENNEALEHVPHTTNTDVLSTQMEGLIEWFGPDLIWASPPCLEFSQGYSAPKPWHRREGIEFTPSLKLVKRAKELIDGSGCQYWVIENVVGAIKDFQPILGKPRLIIGSFVLWGNFPLFAPPLAMKKHSKNNGEDWSSNPLRSNIRAKVPLPLSSILKETIETQRNLF